MLPHRTAVRIRIIIIASRGCCENKMRSSTENAWQSAWHNRSAQRMADAFKVPTDFKVFLSPNSPGRPAPEARGPRAPAWFPEAEDCSSGVRSCSSPLDPGGRKDPLPPCPQQRPRCAGTSWLCQEQAMLAGPHGLQCKMATPLPGPSQGFMDHRHNTRCVKQELMQGGFAGG